jgi:hypothetical protein
MTPMPARVKTILEMARAGRQVEEIASELGCSIRTVYRALVWEPKPARGTKTKAAAAAAEGTTTPERRPPPISPMEAIARIDAALYAQVPNIEVQLEMVATLMVAELMAGRAGGARGLTIAQGILIDKAGALREAFDARLAESRRAHPPRVVAEPTITA